MGVLKIEEIPHYTYDDYKNWEGEWEIIGGVAYAMSPAPMIDHQAISAKIARYLDEAIADCKKCQALLPVDWKIAEDTVVQPDNSVICYKPTNPAYLTKAPKIIFEILSPSTAKKDTGIKFSLYEKEGVKYYIIVDPKERVAKVYENKEGHYIKLCDVTDERVTFVIEECAKEFTFNFANIW
ncbi:hypothetical protein MNB_SM-7-738 [hydrothermal vent metagenome]|uniref:Putative restriction endonuclease domain-containing protein n=1 Tax=hydrothermal vent metagenome TaxID=652676 RepID=A0A1W1C3J2_9ZZZZ